MKIRSYFVKPDMPEVLQPLVELAHNVYYSWHFEVVELFIRLNPERWEESHQNPVMMLGLLSPQELQDAANDESFVASLNRAYKHFKKYMDNSAWFAENHGESKDMLTAYFSMEYGLDVGLPMYSGGLGVLSGDHLKSASDLGLPLVGVGLLYKKGYFRQVLNLDGWQMELYPDNDWYNMPATLERNGDDLPLTVEIPLADETICARIWRVQVGRIPLYLLDTNIPDNQEKHRDITSKLYGGDKELRIRQEVVLGIGGVRALSALGLKPSVYHMNEGHSAFLGLERIRALMVEEGVTAEQAWEHVFATSVFTTHTPVPAGNETFDPALVQRYLAPLTREINVPWNRIHALGRQAKDGDQGFGMTVLALRTAAFCNGVSALHGEVSREMWKGLWPTLPVKEVPITSITNGIHTASWLSHDLMDLFERYLGPKFFDDPGDPANWARVESIPSSELWRFHRIRKERLVFFVRKRLDAQLRRQGAGIASLKAAEDVLNPDALTIGFSRRFATYKRANLLFEQPERLIKLLMDAERPVQIVFAGKAHPQDLPAKEIIKEVIHFTRDPRIRAHLVFLEDYDINVARYLVQGVDVWLNTPRRPMEASGTSGMKAAANGALNVSILDGWWAEGYARDTGWPIGDTEGFADQDEQDRVECEALFNVLEREVVPMFYDRERSGLPREWVGMMKASIQKLGPQFSMHRMVREYTEKMYVPAHLAGMRSGTDHYAGAKELAGWREKVRQAWSGVSVELEPWQEQQDFRASEDVELFLSAKLGALAPNDVAVEILYGPLDTHREISNGQVLMAQYQEEKDGKHRWKVAIPCRITGCCGFAARILPVHGKEVHPYTPFLLTWEP